MPGGELRSKWFFADERSQHRDTGREWRIRARCVSGARVPTDGLPVVSEWNDDEQCQLLSLTGLAELESCVRAWGCPVTISPADGDLPWMLELEDGIHRESPLF
jgi:hypothetical protein